MGSQLGTPKVPDVLAILARLSRAELVTEYEQLYRRPPPPYSHPKLLSLAIAHRCQEQVSGGRDRVLERRLKRLSDELRTKGCLSTTNCLPIKLGTRLLREWEGETHTVTVEEDGYLYRDASYRSLSAIARAITGTRWSGPVFFGLKEGRRSA